MNPRLLAAFVLALPALASAQISPAGPAVEVLPGNGYRILQGTSLNATAPLSRSIVGSAAGVTVTDTINVAGKGGNMSVQVGRLASYQVLGAALARSLPLVSAVVSVASVLNDLRIKDGMMDPGQSKIIITEDNWCVSGQSDSSGNPLYCGSSASAAEAKYESYWRSYKGSSVNPTCGYTNGQPVYGTWSVFLSSVSSDGTAYYYSERRTCTFPGNTFDNTYSWSIVTKRASITRDGCPKIFDSLTGQLYEPGLSGDGKCLTGRYTEPVTESSLPPKVAVYGQTTTGQTNLANAAKGILDNGGTIGQTSADTPIKSLTGPASQTGTPTSSTTTGPTGTVQTTTTPTYNYTYQGDTITYNITNTTVTNTTNAGGQTTTTTTTETKPQDKTDLCAQYPDIAACAKLGTPTDAEPLPTKNVPVAATPDGRWQPSAGACTRGAITLSTGVTVNLWKPFCDFFSMLHGVIVAGFALAGALVFLRGL